MAAKKATTKKAPAKKTQPKKDEPVLKVQLEDEEPKAAPAPAAEGADPAPEEFEKLFAPAEPVKTPKPMKITPDELRQKFIEGFFKTCKDSGLRRQDVNMAFNVMAAAMPMIRRQWHKEFPSENQL